MTRRSVRLVIIASFVVGASVSAAGAAAPMRSPATLVVSHRQIDAFAQDGDHIAWATRGGPCGTLVHVRTLTSTTTTAFDSPRGITCRRFALARTAPTAVVALALGGTRALWQIARKVGRRNYEGYLVTASASDRIDRFVGWADVCADECDSLLPAPIAGDGKVLAYSGGGLVMRVLARRVRLLSGFDPAVEALAASTRRVAAIKLPFFETDSSPTWSPDGLQLAFARERAPDDGDGAIYVARADGSEARRLSSPRAWDDTPAWSPDGGKIVFVRRGEPTRDPTLGLWVMDADGSGRTRLLPLLDVVPCAQSWSPDGRKLVFATSAQVVTVGADGTAQTRLVTDQSSFFSYARWSPDGARVVFVRRNGTTSQLYVIGADGTGERRLTEFANGSQTRDPQWSPDGARIAFTSSEGSDDPEAQRLHVIDADGTGLAILSDARVSAPRWSPDGGKLAVMGAAGDVLYVTDSHGGPVRELARDAVGVPAWSPDGKELAFSARAGAIEVVTPDGGVRSRLTHPKDAARVVDVEDVATRQRLSRGTIVVGLGEEQDAAVALSGALVVVLRVTPRNAWLQVRDPSTSRVRREIAVPRAIAPRLSISGRRIVYSVGRKIEAADALTGRTSTVAVAASNPVGLSIEGRRVAWAENVAGHGRIRAVYLATA